MAHVEITTGTDVPGCARIVVDGHDLTHHVLADGFSVTIPERPKEKARVTMTIIADSLVLDLPDSVIEAVSCAGDSEQGESA